MKLLLKSFALAAAVTFGVAPGTLHGQWGVAFDVHRMGFGDTSLDTSTGGTEGSFHPGGAPAVTIRVDRRMGRMTIGLGLRYARSAVLIETPDLFVGLQDRFSMLEAAPEIRVRIAHTPAGANLHLYGGPVIGVWMFSDEGNRAVPGVVVGIAGEFPLFRKLALWVRAGAGLTRSVFQDGELPPEFERHSTRRTEVSLGLRYGR